MFVLSFIKEHVEKQAWVPLHPQLENWDVRDPSRFLEIKRNYNAIIIKYSEKI
jgi:hypothetical protein